MKQLILVLCFFFSLFIKAEISVSAQAQMIGGVTPIKTLDSLQSRVGSPNSVVQLLGKAAVGDSQGGTYYWDDSSTETPDATYMNIVKVAGVTVGRWKRVYSKANNYTQGVLTTIGGVKTFYIFGVTDANGECTVNLTSENSATGTAIFTEIWNVSAESNINVASANDVIIGTRKATATNLKTITCVFSRGNSQTLGATLLNIAGTILSGLRAAPAGTAVIITVTGI